MRIIPAIDIIDGKCVRLTQGDYRQKTIYSDDPLDMAKQFEDNGIQYLHVVDLDGAKSHEIKNAKILEKLATHTQLKIDFGGGIKSKEDVETALNAGANQITVGSIAAQQPAMAQAWIAEYGADKIILGADCKQRKIATHGWLKSSGLDVVEFIKSYEKNNIQYVIVTDIAKDGMLEGPSFELYREILSQTNIKLIASGGISTIEELKQLKAMGCEGAIIGKAIYEGKISLQNLIDL